MDYWNFRISNIVLVTLKSEIACVHILKMTFTNCQ